MRALSVIQQSHPVKLVPAIAALYKAMWVSRLPIAEPKTFTQVLGEVLGEDVAKGVVEEVTPPPLPSLCPTLYISPCLMPLESNS